MKIFSVLVNFILDYLKLWVLTIIFASIFFGLINLFSTSGWEGMEEIGFEGALLLFTLHYSVLNFVFLIIFYLFSFLTKEALQMKRNLFLSFIFCLILSLVLTLLKIEFSAPLCLDVLNAPSQICSLFFVGTIVDHIFVYVLGIGVYSWFEKFLKVK